ncbi:hypothetical protein [Oceanobacillus salinisoli]|uniref:hypothetical protein n=1 Tax=Oceanobacillus salinisoli TaxID=2678611 RepID=UPI0012E28493|nr:hypothetical protein [Oceanobacillus salinisoli]
MHLDQKTKDLLTEANLFGLLAKRYEYVDPQRHMFFYQKHFDAVMELERNLMMYEGGSHHTPQQMMTGQLPMY